MGRSTRSTPRRGAVAALALAMTAGACGDDGGAADPAATTTTAAAAAQVETSTTVPAGGAPDDRIGHTVDIGRSGNGSWKVEEISGVWWFITPDGRGFFSAGSNGVKVGGTGAADGERRYADAVMAKYGSQEVWADATVTQLDSLGFNTAGAWSSDELMADRMPYTPILSFSRNAPEIDAPPLDDTPLGDFARPLRDYYDPAFTDGAPAVAQEAAACAEQVLCVGVFSDNELNWGPSPTQTTTHLDAYMRLPAGAPGKVALQAFLAGRYDGEVEGLNATWALDLASFDEIQTLTTLRPDLTPGKAGGEVTIEELTTGEPDDILALIVVADPLLDRATPAQRADRKAFRDHVAEHYFSTVEGALDTAAPDVLDLGTRFVSIFTDAAVLDVAARHVDVLSINSYEFSDGVHALIDANWAAENYLFDRDPHADLATVHDLTGKPILLTEWSYRARVPDGPPSDFPPSYPTYDTQAERADGYRRYMNAALSHPSVVGTHWFIHSDQPAQGRGDGENNNFGIVDIDDNLWEELAATMREVNLSIPERRLELG